MAPEIKRYVRPLQEVREILVERAPQLKNPFEMTDPSEVNEALAELTSLDHDHWAATFGGHAERHEEAAVAAEGAGDADAARQGYLLACNWWRLARYPSPNSPGKRQAYERYKAVYLKAARYFDPPLEEVSVPFDARPGEPSSVRAYLRRPPGQEPVPLVIYWGGIDSYKEDRRANAFLARGLAMLALDLPGTGESPVTGDQNAERVWDSMLAWANERPDLDGGRIGFIGASTGGYWATKLAHTRIDQVRAVVNHGGCVHYAFQPEWIETAQHGEYPYELAETLARAFGRSTIEEWAEYAPSLSLLDKGVLDEPCAPLLCINGLHDSVFPIADHYLLMEHGSPKTARFFDTAHMGDVPKAIPMMADWLAGHLKG